MFVLGVDIGGTKTAWTLTDMDTGSVARKGRFQTPIQAGPREFLRILTTLLEGAPKPEVAGFSVPGQVDAFGNVLCAGNLGWRDIPFLRLVENELRVPAFVEQDANAAALGEKWRGGAKDCETFAFLALGTGIGAGLFIEGKLYRGVHNAAGELGDLIPHPEALAEVEGAPPRVAEIIGGRIIRDKATRVVGQRLNASRALSLASTDERLEELAEEVADYVAYLVVSICALLDPEAIFVGGGTASAGPALFARVESRIKQALKIRPLLLPSALGEDAQLHGAVYGAMARLRSESLGTPSP